MTRKNPHEDDWKDWAEKKPPRWDEMMEAMDKQKLAESDGSEIPMVIRLLALVGLLAIAYVLIKVPLW